MPPLLLLVACCVLIAVLTVSYLWSRNKGTSDAPPDRRASTIPGPAPKDKETGNLSEIGAAGSLHHFLSGQHMRYGPVVGFWIGKLYVVSVASPNGFKKLVHVFNRPPELFQLFEPLITSQSIQYANYEDGRGRRQLYDRAFSHGSLSQYYQAFQQITDELVAKWSRADKADHLPLHQSMIDLAIKAIALTAFGESLRDDRLLTKLQESYEVCWETMEHSLAHGFPEQGSDAYKQFEDGKEAMYKVLMDILGKKRNDTTVNTAPKIFFDYLLEYDDSEKRIFADGISYMIGGFHTTGNMLTWALYYLSRDKAVQDKLADEIKVVLGDQNVNETNIADLKFLRQVQEETLRCSVLAPWGAKFLDEDFEIEGHIIPAKTPIMTSLGVMLKDPNYWPDPERFDPDRFSAENSKNRPAHVFSPFGLAGKRICPGYRFAFSETAVVLATLVRKFRLHMMNEHDVKPVFGLVTSVSEEVWVSLSPR